MDVIYCAYGARKYADQLVQSVRSLRHVHPEARIAVYTRPEFLDFLRDLDVETRILGGIQPIVSDWHDPFMKVRAIHDAATLGRPFLYLDNDTFVAGPLTEAWDLLGSYDCLGVASPILDQRGFLGLAPAPGLHRPPPEVFPEWNGGVLFFAGTQAARDVTRRWLEVLELKIPGGGDQWPLAQALWDSRARLHRLPNLFNCRLPATPVVYGPIRILHADHPDLSSVAQVLNARHDLRQVVVSGQGYAIDHAGRGDQRLF